MDRRTFISWVGLGWVASCLPVALAACTSSDTGSSGTSSGSTASPSPAPSARADGFQPVGTVADLDKNGTLALKDFAGGEVLVIRDPANPQGLVAVNPACTHKGCIVEWKAGQKEFVCPCHDSDFGPDGKVLEGPATEPLKLYTAKIEGDTVVVKA